MSEGPNSNSRRNFLRSSLIVISSATLAGEAPALLGNLRIGQTHRFLSESERRFLLAAVDRLIPADEHWPGAAEAGVVNYIELQMAGAWGRGEMLYRHGPFRKGFGRPGHQIGAFTHGHTLAVDFQRQCLCGRGRLGRRVQRFKPAK